MTKILSPFLFLVSTFILFPLLLVIISLSLSLSFSTFPSTPLTSLLPSVSFSVSRFTLFSPFSSSSSLHLFHKLYRIYLVLYKGGREEEVRGRREEKK